jgi:hypothetical protein
MSLPKVLELSVQNSSAETKKVLNSSTSAQNGTTTTFNTIQAISGVHRRWNWYWYFIHAWFRWGSCWVFVLAAGMFSFLLDHFGI